MIWCLLANADASTLVTGWTENSETQMMSPFMKPASTIPAGLQSMICSRSIQVANRMNLRDIQGEIRRQKFGR